MLIIGTPEWSVLLYLDLVGLGVLGFVEDDVKDAVLESRLYRFFVNTAREFNLLPYSSVLVVNLDRHSPTIYVDVDVILLNPWQFDRD